MKIIGIDISKDTFDTYSKCEGSMKYDNTASGIKEFIKSLGVDNHCVMESTGSYHQQLAMSLFESGINVSVVNPLVIKRFIQMKKTRNKTDKGDAILISQYGEEQELDLWEPSPVYFEESKQIQTGVELYLKQRTALKNKLHSLESRGIKSGYLFRSINRQIKQLNKEIKSLEGVLEGLIKENEPELFTVIKSIPGVGSKTAALLIVATEGFRDFESSKQVSSYFGLAPTERTSGSSIRGKSRISKFGNKQVRNHMFMCSFTACSSNPHCQALYERIVAKGKSKKLALIAVANKLLKIAYGLSKSRMPYDGEYRSVLAR